MDAGADGVGGLVADAHADLVGGGVDLDFDVTVWHGLNMWTDLLPGGIYMRHGYEFEGLCYALVTLVSLPFGFGLLLWVFIIIFGQSDIDARA